MDNGVEYIEQRVDRLESQAEAARTEIKRLEKLAYEAMHLAVYGGKPTLELYEFWCRERQKRGLWKPGEKIAA
jgi:hypothetical protein